MRMVLTVKSARVFGKVMREGEEFECPDKEARLWGALARAVPATGRSERPAAQLSLNSEAAAASRPGARQSRQGRYNRSDMRAED